MDRFFIVSVDTDALKDQRDAFTNFLRAEYPQIGFWHNLPYTWLIVDPTGKLSAVMLREKWKQLSPLAYHLVIEANPITFAAWGLPDSNKWLREYLAPDRWRKR